MFLHRIRLAMGDESENEESDYALAVAHQSGASADIAVVAMRSKRAASLARSEHAQTFPRDSREKTRAVS